jgi:FeS assembly SUF system regulator
LLWRSYTFLTSPAESTKLGPGCLTPPRPFPPLAFSAPSLWPLHRSPLAANMKPYWIGAICLRLERFMVRLGKLTDYGLVLMTCMARAQGSPMRTARDLARESKLPLSTVSKLLKELLQSGLLVSHRGIKGGYVLARAPHEISVVEMIAAIEGPMALTECSTEITGLCNLEPCCPIKTNQQIINQAVRGVLEKITLSDLLRPMHLTNIRDARGRVVTIASGGIQ